MNCNDTCRPGFVPGPPALNYASGCSLAENPTFKTYVLPASVGTDAAGQPYAPKIGEFKNAIVIYEANGNIYIYDSLGTPTLMEKGDYNGTGGGVVVQEVDIRQETGTSETAVMSQNAVSVELSKLDAKATSANTQIASLRSDLDANVAQTKINTTNLTRLTSTTNDLSDKIAQLETGSNVEVVQDKGNSTTAVMSQDAVTTALNDLASSIPEPVDTSNFLSWESVGDKVVTGWGSGTGSASGLNLNLITKDNEGNEAMATYRLPIANAGSPGLLSSTDKTKLNALPSAMLTDTVAMPIQKNSTGQVKRTFATSFSKVPTVVGTLVLGDDFGTVSTSNPLPTFYITGVSRTGYTVGYVNGSTTEWNTGNEGAKQISFHVIAAAQ